MFCPSDFRPYPWMEYALHEFGVRRIKGKKHNFHIDAYFETVGLHEDGETPWCSAFVNWCLKEASLPITKKANARSWLNYTGANMCLAAPTWGCITVLWRGKPSGWQGHVGFYGGAERDKIILLGGNQGRAVSIKAFPADHVLGYTWPAAVPLSRA